MASKTASHMGSNVVLSQVEYRVVGKRPATTSTTKPHSSVRGVGEVPIVPPLAAISSAVSHAIGTRMRSLPITPGKIL